MSHVQAQSIDADPLGEALMALLDEEKRALLEGDLARLPEFAAAKEALLTQLGARSVPVRPGPALLARLRRNQRLLAGALRGLSAVQARIAAWQGLSGEMQTYDPSGRTTRIGHAQYGRIQKKF